MKRLEICLKYKSLPEKNMPVKHNEGKCAYRKYNIVKKMLRNSYFSSFYIKFVLLFLITGCLYEKYTAYFIRPPWQKIDIILAKKI